MSNTETVRRLKKDVDKLNDLFQHFIFDAPYIGSVERYDIIVTADEFGKLGYKSYGYDDIYKEVDKIIESISTLSK